VSDTASPRSCKEERGEGRGGTLITTSVWPVSTTSFESIQSQHHQQEMEEDDDSTPEPEEAAD
jgi:hypothetical protein